MDAESNHCETSFTRFDYNAANLSAVPSAIIEVAEGDPYEPTSAQQDEDNQMVEQFSHNVNTSLHSCRDIVRNVRLLLTNFMYYVTEQMQQMVL